MIDRRFLAVLGFLAVLAAPVAFAEDPPCAGVSDAGAAAPCPAGQARATATAGCTPVACTGTTAPSTGCTRANGTVVSAGAAI